MRVWWQRSAGVFEMLVRDVRHACRRLGRSPAFTIVASLSLALGIGANTAAFGVLYAALLRPLPVRDPGSLAIVAHANQLSMSYPAYAYLRDHSSSLDGLAAFRQTPVNLLAPASRRGLTGEPTAAAGGEAHLAADATTERVTGMLVSGNYFSVLGVNMAIGSPIRADDDVTPGSGGARGPVAVISHQTWTRRFGGDTSIVGRAIRVNGGSFTVIGVAPPEFRGTRVGSFPDVFVPFAFAVPLTNIPNALTGPGNNWIRLIGRVKPGVSFAQATAEVTATFQRFSREQLLPTLPTEESRRRALERAMAVTPGGAGLFEMGRGVGPSLYISMGLMGVVLLLACVNVANLLVARAERYHRDTAIHLALGAARARLWSQTLVESLLLGMLGVGIGLVLAIWMRGLLAQLIPASQRIDLSMDATVVALSATVGLATAVSLGAVTMWQGARRDVTRALKGDDLTTRLWLRKGLIVGQLALSVVVLVAAALFGQTLRNLGLIDPGFDRERVLIASLDPSGHSTQAQTAFYERLLSEVRASPGVVSAALSGAEPMGTTMGWSFGVRRGATGALERVNSWVAIVSPDYFKTMGIPILRGTDLRLRREPEGVSRGAPGAPWSVLVNETFVTRLLGDQDPIGARVTGNGTMTFEVVGVVKDSATIGIREHHEPVMYVAFSDRVTGPLVLHVRAAVPPAGLIATVEGIVQRLASDVPIFDVRTIDQQLDRLMGRERTFAQLTSIFGVLALLLSAVGLYGLIAYAVGRRTKELGIRVALGAEPGRILRMVLREATLLVTFGLALGVPLAAALAGTIASLLYGVQPGDWKSLTSAVVVLLAVALLAAWVPARRAARIDPLVALRHE